MKSGILIAAAALALSACMHMAATPPAEGASTGEASACGAERYQTLVGQPQSALPALPDGARVVCHNCAVTMDYREDRLNVWLDEQGRVGRVTCG